MSELDIMTTFLFFEYCERKNMGVHNFTAALIPLEDRAGVGHT